MSDTAPSNDTDPGDDVLPDCETESESNCDGEDSDGDGIVDDGCACNFDGKSAGVCTEGTVSCEGSCTKPTGYETDEYSCDGIDNDCDGVVDTKSVRCPWTRMIGTDGSDTVYGAATDGEGNVYVVGQTDEPLDGESYNGGPWDGFLVKYDESGTRQWTRLFGSSMRDWIGDLTTDGQGNVYVAGQTDRSMYGEAHNGGKWDGFVVKFDGTGTRQWTRLIGGFKDDEVGALATDAQGNVYAAGWTETGLDGETYNGGNRDGYLIKLDGSGTRQWTRIDGSSAEDENESVQTDGQGNVYVAGGTESVPRDEGLNGEAYAGADDGYVVNYDSSGARQWTRVVGTSSLDRANSVATDGQGNVYVAGVTESGLNGETPNGEQDAFVVKYDGAGARQWTRLDGTSGWNAAESVTADGQGNVYVAGKTAEGLNGETFHGGPVDGYVVKYTTMGSRQWTRLQGTAGRDWASGVATGGQESVYLVGWAKKGLNGEAYNGGDWDGFLVKMTK